MTMIDERNAIRGWWFGGDTLPHHDDRPVSIGEVHRVEPPIVACKRGLHCSRHALDALEYATGSVVWRVEVWGEVHETPDKVAAEYRRYLCRLDATHILRRFACREALAVLPDDAPSTVREYLTLADRATEEQRYAALDAAWSAASSAALDAALDAAWSAARSAACDATLARQRRTLDAMLFGVMPPREG